MAIGLAAAAAGSAVKASIPIVTGALKLVPVVGTVTKAAIGVGTLTATITAALKTATAIIGLGKLAILPIIIASLAYYNYDMFDPENRPFNVKQVDREYDFIIVGGGSAGSVLANRLTEISDWKVLLLEAGGHETEISDVPILSLYLHKSKLDWKYRAQPQTTACQAMVDNRSCWTRGKVLGGSSVLNTMLYIRGNRRDFDHWASLGNPGWDYESILPYFRKSEDQRNPYLAKNTRQHGTGGYQTVQNSPYNTPLGLTFLQAGEEMGYDIVDVNGEQQTGFSLYQYTMRGGMRCSTSKAFLRPIRLRKNLHIALHSHVTRVILDETNKRAIGIEFIRNEQHHQVFARKEVILSAGAIGSPHILLNSGIGPGGHLQKVGVPVRHHLPGVGENLQDHYAIGGLHWLIEEEVSIVTPRLINVNTAVRYAVTQTGPMTSSVGLETTAFLTTKYGNQSDDWPDMNFMMASISPFADVQVKRAHGLRPEYFREMFGDLKHKDAYTVFPMILRPKSRGTIRLESKNPLRPPLLYANYFHHPEDIKVMREGVKMALAIGESNVFKKFGSTFLAKPAPNCRHLPLYTDEYWECFCRQYTLTIYHMSGTTKMGPATDPMAVVNSQLMVHGIQGLRVIDAGIMPTVTSGNINAPVIMIGEKGADLIKGLWLRDLIFKRGKFH